jgi:hypothetical protein
MQDLRCMDGSSKRTYRRSTDDSAWCARRPPNSQRWEGDGKSVTTYWSDGVLLHLRLHSFHGFPSCRGRQPCERSAGQEQHTVLCCAPPPPPPPLLLHLLDTHTDEAHQGPGYIRHQWSVYHILAHSWVIQYESRLTLTSVLALLNRWTSGNASCRLRAIALFSFLAKSKFIQKIMLPCYGIYVYHIIT